MLIRGATREDIEAALDVANEQFGGNLCFKALEDVSGPRSLRFKVRLTVDDLEGPGCRRGFLSYIYGWTNKPRRIRSACYHAIGAWMVALLERAPEAIIESGSMHLQGGRYRGARGFLRAYQSVGDNNVGSQTFPIAFSESCNCHEHDCGFIDTETLRYLGWVTEMPSPENTRVWEVNS
jgi:hypothetical protein